MGDQPREVVLNFLQNYDLRGLSNWAKTNRGAVRSLFSLLLSDKPLISRRSATALGLFAADLYPQSPEKVREILRRIFWGMNDESGNLIRLAPITIAEILVSLPELVPEFGPILVSYHETEPFEAGVFWAIAQLSRRHPEVFQFSRNILLLALGSPHPAIRAYAAQTLSQLNDSSSSKQFHTLWEDNATFEECNTQHGEFYTITVRDYLKNLTTAE